MESRVWLKGNEMGRVTDAGLLKFLAVAAATDDRTEGAGRYWLPLPHTLARSGFARADERTNAPSRE